jgi:hypothetical protein
MNGSGAAKGPSRDVEADKPTMIARAFAQLGDALFLCLFGLAIFAASDWVTGKPILRDSPGSVVLGLMIGVSLMLAVRLLLARWRGRNALQ